MNRSCVLGSLCLCIVAVLAASLATKPDVADKNLQAMNEQLKASNTRLQDKLLALVDSSKNELAQATKELQEEKKRIAKSCGK